MSTSGEQISLFDGIAFPTESEQITYIDKAETEAFSAFSLSQDDIDTVLRYGGNADDSRMRITAEFMKDKPTETHAAFLKSLYHGGNGFHLGMQDISAWYAEDGIRIASGRQAENARYAQVILWNDAAKRIGELLSAGEFATETELAEAAGNERRLAAQELVYLQRDIREDVRDKYFDKSWFDGIFSESCDRITDILSDDSMRNIVTDAASRFAEDYAKDKSLLLFHYHKPEETARKLRELADMKRTFRGGLTEMPPAEEFITEDEINHVFSGRGSGVSGGRARIYEYFTAEHTAKEKQDFLKNEYGTGGHSHALSGSSGSSEWHDGKGIHLQKSGCHDVQISWQNAVNHIQNLIRSDRYFKPAVKNVPKTVETAIENEPEPEVMPDKEPVTAQNYHITDDTLGEAGQKTKFRMNMDAIYTLKILENKNRNATPEEQEILAKYVGWGGLAEAFDEDNSSWIREYKELKAALTDEEYAAARASTLNAHYTSPTVVKDKVDLLLGGVADYITKPFDTSELLARVAVRLRESYVSPFSTVYVRGDLKLDTASHGVSVSEKPVSLTRTEYAILKLLMQNSGQVMAKSVLLERISEDTPDCTENSLKTHISNLRGKLREASGKDYIEAVWGIGFRLRAET